EGAALRVSDALYTASIQYAATAAREHAIPPARIQVIPYGLDLGALDRACHAPLAERFPALAGRRLVVLSVGTAPGRKGAGVFLQAARACADRGALWVLVSSQPELLGQTAMPS